MKFKDFKHTRMLNILEVILESFYLIFNQKVLYYSVYTLFIILLVKIFYSLYNSYSSDVKLICGNKELKKDIMANCPTIAKGVYYPTILLANAQL